MLKLINIRRYIFLSLIFMSFFSCAVVLLKNLVSPFFGVLKDLILYFLLFSSCFSFSLKEKSLDIKFLILLFIFFLISSIGILLSEIFYTQSLFSYIYQFKIDLFYAVTIIIISINKDIFSKRFITLIIKCFIIVGFFHASISIFQRFFFSYYLGLLGINLAEGDVTLGNIDGLVIQTQGGNFRSIGITSTPMAGAELSLISLFLYAYLSNNKWLIKTGVSLVFLVAIYCTGYKTVYLTTAIFLVAYMIRAFETVIYKIGSVLLFLFGMLSVNTLLFYNVFKSLFPTYAEFSIRLRYDFVKDVVEQRSDNAFCFFNCTYGFNGNYLEKAKGSVPLDSIYIYVLSNFGFISIAIMALLYIFTYIYASNYKIIIGEKTIPIGLYSLLFFSGNFFWNQPFINFPSGWHVLIIMCIAYVVYKNENIKKYSLS